MAKCFRCGSRLYLVDPNNIDSPIKCTVCTAVDRETGHITSIRNGEVAIIKGFVDKFWLYHWAHNNYSDEWYFSNRRMSLTISVILQHWGEHQVRFRYHDRGPEEWFYLDKSWKTLKTAKKWALVYGLNDEWVNANVPRQPVSSMGTV